LEKWSYSSPTVLAGSVDSLGPTTEEEEIALEEARRGSGQSEMGSLGLFNRRGSRLSEIAQLQKLKQKKGRFKDKQGFTWRPFIAADEELPLPRVPRPHIELVNLPRKEVQHICDLSTQQETAKSPKAPDTSTHDKPISVQSPQLSPQIKPNLKPVNGDIVRAPPRTLPRQKPNSLNLPVATNLSPGTTRSPSTRLKTGQKSQSRNQDPETSSVKSIHSDNSFQTASSDVPVNFIPKQIKDNYKTLPQGSVALERKSSVRAIQQQQYNVLTAGMEGKQPQQNVGNRTQSKSTR